MSACRKCGQSIVWGETAATATKPGKRIPLDPPEKRNVRVGTTGDGSPIVRLVDTYIAHFASCPDR